MQFCKYCGKEMQLDDVDRDRKGNAIAKWFLCECGGACYAERTYGFWKLCWTKEDEQ